MDATVSRQNILHRTTVGDSHTWCGRLLINWNDLDVVIHPSDTKPTCRQCLVSVERGVLHRPRPFSRSSGHAGMAQDGP